MSLRGFLLPVSAEAREIEGRIVDAVMRLCAETNKQTPNAAVVGHILDDLDALAADYQRAKTRKVGT